MPDVRLPSGVIIRGVPEGTPRDEIRRKAIAAGLASESDFQPRAQDNGMDNRSRDRLAVDPRDQQGNGQFTPFGAVPEGSVGYSPITGGQDVSVGESLRGTAEGLATLGSSIIAEPIAGIAGLATSLSPAFEPGAGAQVVQQAREELTYQPRTESGQRGLRVIGESASPVAERISGIESFLGDSVFEATGSPGLAAAAATAPTAVLEVLGVAAGRGAVRTAARQADASEGRLAARALEDAAPTAEQLRGASKTIFNEIDDLGARLNPTATNSLISDIRSAAREVGARPKATPRAFSLVEDFQELAGAPATLDQVDELRRVAQNVARSSDPSEAAAAVAVIDSIDSFLDTADSKMFDRGAAGSAEVGQRYRVARKLWGRAKKSELLGEAFEKARNQASGFENGIRTQFRAILNNKRQRRFFADSELDEMRKVVRGDEGANIAKLIGRVGFSEGGATNIVGGSIGAAAGASIFGPAGGFIVPAIGTVSRSLSQRLTRRNAEFADAVIRAGKDGRRVAQSYIRNTPKAQRSAAELSELLMQPDVDLSGLDQSNLVREAARLADERRATLFGATVAPSAREENGQDT